MEEGRQILILSDRISHLEELDNLLEKEEITSKGFYIGKMKQKDLDVSATKNVLLATYSMASEALDIPSLNTLVMVTSRRNIEQSVGRILRRPDSKIQPTIIDFNDKIPCFQSQGEFRKKYYLKKGYEVITYDMNNNKIISETEENQLSTNVTENVSNEELDFVD